MSDSNTARSLSSTLPRDLTSGVVVFLVALPLCLGIALASGAPLFSGLVSGIVGGLVVGAISGSHTSVSGPAAGLTAIVAAQIATLGSFEAFLFAVILAGVIQIALGIARAGELSAFFPSSVIKGLLAAIGVILILKQIPHLLGHDLDPEGEMSFRQPDEQTTFSELGTLFQGEIHPGAAVVGLVSIALLLLWSRAKPLKNSIVPGPLVVVLVGVALQVLFQDLGRGWAIGTTHLVQVPVASSASDLLGFLRFPDVSQWTNSSLYVAAVTIAIVASLETLLNLEAVDKLDQLKRSSPPSRELVAQGCGNVVAGLLGGLPVTSVIVRSSVNVNSGSRTKLSAVFHGVLLLVCVVLLPVYLNMIPLAALAGILLVTGFKLANPALFRELWRQGRSQFLPFLVTLLAIVFTDLLIGVVIGLGVSLLFILHSSLRTPIRRIVETHLDGDILHVELPDQVTFLNRAALDRIFREAASGTHVLVDASGTEYIDPDVRSQIQEFVSTSGPARGVTVSLRGFKEKYELRDDIKFADFSTRELQDRASAQQILEILLEGNRRFRTGQRLTRDLGRQVGATASGQNPLAVVLSCIDSRVPAEIIFDLGIGDIFSVRVAGNVIRSAALGSVEYGVAIAGVKLVLVLGHTSCGAVSSAIELSGNGESVEQATGCPHLHTIVEEIGPSIAAIGNGASSDRDPARRQAHVDDVAKHNVAHSVQEIVRRSRAVRERMGAGVLVVGAMYDVRTGTVELLPEVAVVGTVSS